MWHIDNLFIYQARGVYPGPSRVSDGPFFCRKHSLWSFCFDGRTKMDFLFMASMEKKKSHPSSFPMLHLSSRKAQKRSISKSPPPKKKIKGFINYVYCRNCAVRNPAGTRLDSCSLVNKQVLENIHLEVKDWHHSFPLATQGLVITNIYV